MRHSHHSSVTIHHNHQTGFWGKRGHQQQVHCFTADAIDRRLSISPGECSSLHGRVLHFSRTYGPSVGSASTERDDVGEIFVSLSVVEIYGNFFCVSSYIRLDHPSVPSGMLKGLSFAGCPGRSSFIAGAIDF